MTYHTIITNSIEKAHLDFLKPRDVTGKIRLQMDGFQRIFIPPRPPYRIVFEWKEENAKRECMLSDPIDTYWDASFRFAEITKGLTAGTMYVHLTGRAMEVGK